MKKFTERLLELGMTKEDASVFLESFYMTAQFNLQVTIGVNNSSLITDVRPFDVFMQTPVAEIISDGIQRKMKAAIGDGINYGDRGQVVAIGKFPFVKDYSCAIQPDPMLAEALNAAMKERYPDVEIWESKGNVVVAEDGLYVALHMEDANKIAARICAQVELEKK